MKFNELIQFVLEPIFAKYGFHMESHSSNEVLYKSSHLEIRIVYNPWEKSSILWLGRDNHDKVEVTNELLKEVFKSDIKLALLPEDKFINNIRLFFENEGKLFLENNQRMIEEIEAYSKKRNEEYTNDLILRQTLELANNAWENKNLSVFIELINRIGLSKIPESYIMKYNIAVKAQNRD